MQFPKQENEIEQFAMTMAVGFWSHELDFPSVDPMQLIWTIVEYKDARNAMSIAISQAKLAAKQKEELLDVLKRIMKDCLRKSEVDVAAEPIKLTEIGWGPRDGIHHLRTPNQPTNLKAAVLDNTTIHLSWKKDNREQNVRNFLIESRSQSKDSVEDWQLAASSYENKIILENQPKQTNLEYRVRAVNPSGQSIPSNTIQIHL
jgi:hypothetical protein